MSSEKFLKLHRRIDFALLFLLLLCNTGNQLPVPPARAAALTPAAVIFAGPQAALPRFAPLKTLEPKLARVAPARIAGGRRPRGFY
jgi:hypothetical protein